MTTPVGRERIPEGPPAPDDAQVERQLDRLQEQLKRLELAYQRFFNGDLALSECQQVQEEIRISLRALRNTKLQRSVDRFRLGTLEARFNSLSEMYGRRVRLIEEGRAPTQRERTGSSPRLDIERGVVVAGAPSEDAVTALFQGLQDRTGRAPSSDLGVFRDYLERQVTEIRRKTGCGAVQFRLVTEEGKVKLKARPLKGAASAP
jgi:hypothetical protein